MQTTARQRRPVLLSAAQVAGVVVVHGVVIAGVIGALGVSERDVGPLSRYWGVITLIPSLAWAALVLARSAAWRRASSFWLPGAAAIIAILAFVSGMILRFGPLELPGVGFGMLVSSWILIAVALVFALATQLIRALRRRAAASAEDAGADDVGAEIDRIDPAGADADLIDDAAIDDADLAADRTGSRTTETRSTEPHSAEPRRTELQADVPGAAAPSSETHRSDAPRADR